MSCESCASDPGRACSACGQTEDFPRTAAPAFCMSAAEEEEARAERSWPRHDDRD